MKKTATKYKNRFIPKKPLHAHKSWLRIYSHVAYFYSALNLFLFPARANVQGATEVLNLNSPPALFVCQISSEDSSVEKSPQKMPVAVAHHFSSRVIFCKYCNLPSAAADRTTKIMNRSQSASFRQIIFTRSKARW